MKKIILLTGLVLSLAGFGCGTETEEPLGDDVPCGIRDCSIDEASEDIGGPDSISDADFAKGRDDIEEAVLRVTADGLLDVTDVQSLFEETGNNVSLSEMLAIRDSLTSTDYDVAPDAEAEALYLARRVNVFEHELEFIDNGLTRAGTEVPIAVQDLLARAALNGGFAYDITETEVNEMGQQEGIWNPYPSVTLPELGSNMAWSYTEITPARLLEDLNDTDIEYQQITGTTQKEYCPPFGGACREYTEVTYDQRVGGTGNISSHYDEAHHPDEFARGRSGQIWANNCAILGDGTLHCLPAARRTSAALQRLILTIPGVARGGDRDLVASCLYHGHLDATAGVFRGVEMSGRLSKEVAKGKARTIDPIAFLEAWGFEVSTDRVRYGNTRRGTPVRDTEQNVIREDD